MRTLHVYRTSYTETFGGVEQFLKQLCPALAARGHDVTILTLCDDPSMAKLRAGQTAAPSPRRVSEATVDGVRILRCRTDVNIASNAMSWAALGVFKHYAARADLIHYNYPWPWGDVMALGQPQGVPAVVTYHSDIVRQRWLRYLYAPLEQVFLSRADALVATSPAYASGSANLQRYAAKVQVIPLGMDDPLAESIDDAAIQKWQTLLSRPFFLFVGALRYYKGLSILLDAMKGQDFQVVIAGQGPQESALRRQADQLGLKHIVWAGKVSEADKRALLHLCHAFVFPSPVRAEAFGLALLEAAAMGKPMISAEIGTGTSYINIDGETGLVVPPCDSAALRVAMRRMLSDLPQAQAWGQGARQRYHRIFTATRMVDAYEKMFTDISGCDRRRTQW